MILVLLTFALCTVLIVMTARKRKALILPLITSFFIVIPGEVELNIPGDLPNFTFYRYLILVLIVIYIKFKKNTEIRDKSINRPPFIGLISLSIISMIISTVLSVNRLHSMKSVISNVLEYLLLYIIYYQMVVKKETIYQIYKAMVIAITMACFIALLSHYFGFDYRAYLPKQQHRFDNLFDVARGNRFQSVFPHPILFGSSIGFSLMFLILWISSATSTKTKITLWISLLIHIYCLYKSLSRGPWLATLLMIIFNVMFSDWSRKKVIKTIFIIGLLSIVAILMRPGVYTSLANLGRATFDSNSLVGSSYSYRFALLRLAISTLGHSMMRALFGYGPGTFFDLRLSTWFGGRWYPFYSCDSSWIEFMFSVGYIGFVIRFILFGGTVLYSLKNIRKTTGLERDFNSTITSVLLGYYFMMTNVAIYGWGQSGYLLWILIALSAKHSNLSDNLNSGSISHQIED